MHDRPSDWKKFKRVRERALERLCTRVLSECLEIIGREGTAHERYIRMFEIVRDRDREIASLFNVLSRSQADFDLSIMYRRGLVTEEELQTFSQETQERIRRYAGDPLR